MILTVTWLMSAIRYLLSQLELRVFKLNHFSIGIMFVSLLLVLQCFTERQAPVESSISVIFQFKKQGSLCRKMATDCDVPEYCPGDSSDVSSSGW